MLESPSMKKNGTNPSTAPTRLRKTAWAPVIGSRAPRPPATPGALARGLTVEYTFAECPVTPGKQEVRDQGRAHPGRRSQRQQQRNGHRTHDK